MGSKLSKCRQKRKKRLVEEHGAGWNAWQTLNKAVQNPEVDLLDPEVLLKVMSTSFHTVSSSSRLLMLRSLIYRNFAASVKLASQDNISKKKSGLFANSIQSSVIDSFI